MSLRDLIRVTELACIKLNTPVSLSVVLLLRHKEYAELARKRVSPDCYLDCPNGVERYRRDAQAVALIQKSPALPTGLNRRKVAEENFLLCEEQCLETNVRLTLLKEQPLGALDSAASAILARAGKWIGRMLGPLPLDLVGRMGPGTVFELKGSTFSTMADKLLSIPHMTRSCEQTFRFMWEGSILERFRVEKSLHYTSFTEGNRFTTVPKDGTKDRGICIEPFGNLWCQLGIGSYMKERLASCGIYIQREPDLNPLERMTFRARPNGQTIHRGLAREASITGDLCTIDLSNASDTVAKVLVALLLPPLWHQLLLSVRSPKTLIKGRWHVLEKFSSMGNGSTFELETTIFCGLIHGVTGLIPGKDFSVYGDDIIIPTAYAKDVLACLKFFGFTPNERKTFTTGFFRESCGGDYFCGVDVRPFFFDGDIPTYPVQWFPLHNALVRRSLLLAAKHVAMCVPVPDRVFGPDRNDLFLVGSPSRWAPFSRVRVACHGVPVDLVGSVWLSGRALKPLTVPLERWGHDSVIPLAVMGAKSIGLHPANKIVGQKRVLVSVS